MVCTWLIVQRQVKRYSYFFYRKIGFNSIILKNLKKEHRKKSDGNQGLNKTCIFYYGK